MRLPTSLDAELPSARRGLWRAMQLAYQAEPKLLVVTFVITVGALIPEALNALWLKVLADGVVAESTTRIVWASVGLASSTAAGWILRIVGDRVHFLFRERATIAIEAHVVHLQGSVVSVELHERPEYLDRLQILKDYAFLLNHIYGSFMQTVGSLIRLGITVVLLMTVHPALAVLAVFALPTVLSSSWRAGVERRTEEKSAPKRRLARHLFDLGTMAGPAKEIRVSQNEADVVRMRRTAWDEWFAPIQTQRKLTAVSHAIAWSVFGAAYVGAIAFIASRPDVTAGGVVLVMTAGANLSRYLGMAAGQADFLRWCVDAAKTLVWLELYAANKTERADLSAPPKITTGIRLDDVSFAYPGTDKLVLRNVDLEFPAGAVVAIVGENGAGKTTLVKLLCRMYEPTAGRILVDDVDLARIAAHDWRERLAGAFQDFFRYEFLAKRTIGLGDLPREELTPALEAAVVRGGAGDVVGRLPRGLETQLGPTWDDGVELSFGQWQKLALARGFMRDHPLLLVLDEPTAALDAETEHALFERFAAQSKEANTDGRVTILVSHRFSTVRMADLIVVLDGARVAEYGSHEQLMEHNGLYAELYGIQARAYS